MHTTDIVQCRKYKQYFFGQFWSTGLLKKTQILASEICPIMKKASESCTKIKFDSLKLSKMKTMYNFVSIKMTKIEILLSQN